MKKTLLTITLAVAALAACDKYDDSSLVERVEGLESSVGKLQEAVKELQAVVASGDYITEIREIKDGDKIIGYTLVFNEHGKYNIYYGEDGQKGEPGENGDAFFESVTVSDDIVTMVTADGQTIIVPINKSFVLALDKTEFNVSAGDVATIKYTITNATDATLVESISEGGYLVKVAKTDKASGTITVTAPDPCVSGKVLLVADNGEGKVSTKAVRFINQRIVEPTVVNYGANGDGDTFDVTLEGYSSIAATASEDWITVSSDGSKVTVTVAANTSDAVRLGIISLTGSDEVENASGTVYVGQAAKGAKMVYDSFRESALGSKWVGDLSVASMTEQGLALARTKFTDSEENHGRPIYYDQVIRMCDDSKKNYNGVIVSFDFKANGAQCALMAYNAVGYSTGEYTIPSGTMCYDCWANDVIEGETGGNWWCINASGWDAMADGITGPYTKWMRLKMFNGYDPHSDGVGSNWGGYAIYTLEEENGVLKEKACVFHAAKWWFNNNPSVDNNNPNHGGYMGIWVRNHPFYPTGYFRNFCISYQTNG